MSMKHEINDGGPAFPVHWPTATSKGMSLRDYFIAHAPAEPQPWFQPVMEQPEPDASKLTPWPIRPQNMTPEERHEYEGIGDWLSMEDLKEPRIIEYVKAQNAVRDEKEAYTKAFAAWNKLRDRERYIQWPAAWADAMLAEREKGGAA